MGYSKLPSVILHQAQKAHKENGEYRFYHNWEHVERCYFHASDTFGFSYDEELDLAIAFHDSVYDDQPDRELRSAQLMESYRTNHAPSKASELILSTTNHIPFPDPRMVLVDLADFMFDDVRQSNFEKTFRENLCLYPKAPVRYILKVMVSYLDGLSSRIKSFEKQGMEHYRDFVKINIGIRNQIVEINKLRF